MLHSRDVKIAVLLPFDDTRMFSVHHIAPAVNLAINELNQNKAMGHKYNFSVQYNDSRCNIAEGINKAINFYIKRQVHVYFGPVCDFALAPVARQVGFWNLPLVSVGAMARDFSLYRLTQYRLMTRVGPVNFRSLYYFFKEIMSIYRWHKIKMLYSKTGQDYLLKSLCHFSIEALHYDLESGVPKIQQDYFRVDENTDKDHLLRREIGLDYSVNTKP
ncbi:atrial natriuretic peptide receptor 3-like [Gigantopelta aegis]|uniref:atrial natriuretic peptide receptor 3-like n=1 Tax=Gigantopelta aegis TaxID=1735272 RepID=UPI001B887A4A|nr:atrial natriuretic peptide receptor 3-like [Gigantopelta aegis]